MFTKYRELGLALIPIRAEPIEKMKAPVESNWQQFCERLPTEEECAAWERSHNRYGLACGPASGILAVDIDSDDAKVLAAAPLSPVRKRGKKGETRFFRYDPKVPSCKVAGIIDILGLGRQTLLPPTTHPEGMAYTWLTPDTLENFDVKDLPFFTEKDLADLRQALEPEKYEVGETSDGIDVAGGPWHNTDPARRCPHGSQDRLKKIANAIIARGASPDEAVRELLRFDDEKHKPTGYFSDPTRADFVADPVTNALAFYVSNLKTFNRRQLRAGETPSVPLVSGSEMLEVNLTPIMSAAWKPLPWPEPTGLLREIRDQIADFSKRNQPALAIGGAIAIGAAAISNRLRYRDCWPNVYVLNIAPTGAGKSFPYTTAKRILNSENGLDLIGAGGYRSSTAMIKDLVGKRERLDLIDECSGIFKTIRDGGVFQSDMMDILNSLWADSGTIFLGPESAGRERVQVWHACVSVLFSTTPDGLKGSISRDFMTQGFMPRCLIFHDSEYGEIGKSSWNEERSQWIVKCLGELAQRGTVDKRNLVAPRPSPEEIFVSDGAQRLLEQYDYECDKRMELEECEDAERHFLSRGGHQAAKLALIHGALRAGKIEELDVEWAISTLQAVWHNAGPLLPQLGAENTQETNVLRVLHLIKKPGSIDHSRLIGKTRFLKTPERNEILSGLEHEGRIAASFSEKRARIWTFIK